MTLSHNFNGTQLIVIEQQQQLHQTQLVIPTASSSTSFASSATAALQFIGIPSLPSFQQPFASSTSTLQTPIEKNSNSEAQTDTTSGVSGVASKETLNSQLTLLATNNTTKQDEEEFGTTTTPNLIQLPLLTQTKEQEQQQQATNTMITKNSQTIAVAACLAYSVTSMLTTLSSKGVLTSYGFSYPILLLLFQHLFTVGLVTSLKILKFITFEDLEWERVRLWLPINMLFVSMLLSGSYTLTFLSVPMVTIFKNFTTLLITSGDYIFFKQPISSPILLSMALMLTGSVVAGFNDLEFNLAGYVWMFINCIVSAGYVLYMRMAMKTTKLSEFGMVYYNNLLSIPFLLPVLLVTGQLSTAMEFSRGYETGFLVLLVFNGLSCVGISLASFWTIKITSPTTFSVVGSLNKIPLTVIGVLLFSTPMTLMGSVSIFIGLSGGVVYSVSKGLNHKKISK